MGYGGPLAWGCAPRHSGSMSRVTRGPSMVRGSLLGDAPWKEPFKGTAGVEEAALGGLAWPSGPSYVR